ncbi:transcriptional regulator [Helicobacter pylori]|nr:transcriptional regulator [Helicobacter pylori]RVZ46879.1 transcriptional regulator [Helicobacter pylori]WQW89350.1 transcriptional regulator [Helicobacter pylori]WQZ19913.1 transcriptional regulator [Helicobacter pylori]WQZ24188.1 transcriptional regulator [Helicobacter pylori]WRE30491.1 transcriptional regulator [Helicobacter pylori]
MIAWSFLKRGFVVAPHFNGFYHQKFMFSCVVKIQRYAIFK